MMTRNIILVALGGAVGSVLRYLLSAAVQQQAQSAFPLGTLAVNVLGCVVIGFVSAVAEAHGVIGTQTKLLLTTGFCGGFTTFSTFMNETLSLTHSANTTLALAYVMASVALGFLGVIGGMQLGRLW